MDNQYAEILQRLKVLEERNVQATMITPGAIKPRGLVVGEQEAGDTYQSNGESFERLPIGEEYAIMQVRQGIASWTNEWEEYTPTWTGFSVAPVNPIQYIVRGGFCTMLLDHTGTSNSATFNFTLPVACKQFNDAGNNVYLYQVAKVLNNSANPTNAGVLGIPYNDGAGTTAKVGLDLSTTAANAFGGFTTSNLKAVAGVIQYPV